MNRFCDLADFTVDELRALLKLAGKLDREPEARALEGKVLALLFLSPSLRTLTSFQAAMARLGGSSFVVSPEMSIHRLEYRNGIVMDGVAAEHIREAAHRTDGSVVIKEAKNRMVVQTAVLHQMLRG